MYVQHLGSSLDTAKEELKGFQRVSMQQGETKTVKFRLQAKDLACWDEARHNWLIEDGRVRVTIGSSSADIKGEKSLTVLPASSR